MAGWTLEVVWMGRTFTWEGVSARLEESWDLFVTSPGVRSVSFRNVVFPPDVNPAKQVLLGRRLDVAVGRLLLDGVLHLESRLDAPIFGGVGHPVAFTLREPPHEDAGEIPGAFDVELYDSGDQSAVRKVRDVRQQHEHVAKFFPQLSGIADSIPWPDVASTSEDRIYQVVFGTPGHGGLDSGGSAVHWPGSPAPLIDTTLNAEKLLAAGHRIEIGGGVDPRVYGPNASGVLTSQQLPVFNEVDANGRIVATVDMSGAVAVDPTVPGKWWIAWSFTDAVPLSGKAGDLLIFLLRQSTLRLDFTRIQSIVPRLNEYLLSGYIDHVVVPWQYISDQLLPILPIAPVSGPDGVYFAMWDPDAPAVDKFVAGPECVFDFEMGYSDAEVVNQYTLRYRYRGDTGGYIGTAIASAQNNLYSAISTQAHGLSAQTHETDVVDDRPTAERICLDQVRMRGTRHLLIGADLSRTRYGHRSVGEMVELTVPRFEMTDQLAFITRLIRDGSSRITAEFAIVDDPLRM